MTKKQSTKNPKNSSRCLEPHHMNLLTSPSPLLSLLSHHTKVFFIKIIVITIIISNRMMNDKNCRLPISVLGVHNGLPTVPHPIQQPASPQAPARAPPTPPAPTRAQPASPQAPTRAPPAAPAPPLKASTHQPLKPVSQPAAPSIFRKPALSGFKQPALSWKQADQPALWKALQQPALSCQWPQKLPPGAK